MFKLTPEIIKADIEAFQARIVHARESLKALPGTAPDWKNRKKLAEQRRILNDEVKHVQRLIGYAQEALETYRL